MKFFTAALALCACAAALPMQAQPETVPDLFERDIESSQPDPAAMAFESNADDASEGALHKRVPTGGPAVGAASKILTNQAAMAPVAEAVISVAQKVAGDGIKKGQGAFNTKPLPQNPNVAIRGGRTTVNSPALSRPQSVPSSPKVKPMQPIQPMADKFRVLQ